MTLTDELLWPPCVSEETHVSQINKLSVLRHHLVCHLTLGHFVFFGVSQQRLLDDRQKFVIGEVASGGYALCFVTRDGRKRGRGVFICFCFCFCLRDVTRDVTFVTRNGR